MSENNAFTHLSLEERRIILTGIKNGSTKVAIAKTLGKDKSTIGKEIKLHRILTHKCKMPLECDNYRGCVHGRNCVPDCPEYRPFHCSRRDRSPGCCDGCSNYSYCRFDKYHYSPEKAQSTYEDTLVNYRLGVNLTAEEAKEKGDIIKPLLKQGLSPYRIITEHPELGICEKTLYNYIETGVFQEVSGISVMDLRRQVSRKLPKESAVLYKKREDRAFLAGRTYSDYKNYRADNPDMPVAQMDTVYNDVSNGPFLQTFKFLCGDILFALYRENHTAQAMREGVEILENILGKDVFRKYASVLLTDRGPEFTDAEGMEKGSDNTRRTRVFYCDPMRSGQKGSLENNHIQLRYILPKETDLRALGLTGQDALNLVLSHINSAPSEKLGGKSPLELTEFLYPDLYGKLSAFGIRKIEKDKIILKPYLLKK